MCYLHFVNGCLLSNLSFFIYLGTFFERGKSQGRQSFQKQTYNIITYMLDYFILSLFVYEVYTVSDTSPVVDD